MRADFGEVESPQVKAFGRGGAQQLGQKPGEDGLSAAEGGEHEHAKPAELVGEVAQYEKGRLVCPVDVVKDDDQPTFAGCTTQCLADLIEQLEPILGSSGEHSVGIQRQRAEYLSPGPVRRRSLGLGAPPPGDGRSARQRNPRNLLRQPGLTDPRLPDTQHEPPASLRAASNQTLSDPSSRCRPTITRPEVATPPASPLPPDSGTTTDPQSCGVPVGMSRRGGRLRRHPRRSQYGRPASDYRRPLMKYVILIHSTAAPWGHPTSHFTAEGQALPREQVEQMDAEFEALLEELAASGELVTGQALAAPTSSTVYKWSSKGTVTTDGPYAEAKEHLAGFFIIDCATPERAREITTQFAGPGDTVELRPTM